MAKYGEGDKRWIVEERVDGQNVHNWHWAEKDCMEWSKTFLSNLLEGLPILSGEGGLWIRTKNLNKVEGEAYVNIRKGKIIPGYELSVQLSWEGEVKDSSSSDGGGNTLLKADGLVDFPYIADENADEDPEIKISIKDEGDIGRRIKEAFVATGKPILLEKVKQYVNAMKAGGPAKDELEVKSKAVKAKVPAAAAAAEKPAEEKKKQAPKKEGFRSISLSERFNCRAKDVYEILMDENRWKGFTQSNARISKEVGGEFSLFDGSITGINVELQDGKSIVQKWRFGSWPEGIFSMVRLTFEEPEPGLTIIKLVQTDVPEEDRYGNATVVENTERGWRELIFHKIRAVFGFGI
ncbi:uncharacterized protein LOC116263262 [Nymphaea colorata]|nr:uncharacterized protein LOC116263262 [Nymphaea colorata]